jgi:cell wall-associated NlpC family hydrolase
MRRGIAALAGALAVVAAAAAPVQAAPPRPPLPAAGLPAPDAVPGLPAAPPVSPELAKAKAAAEALQAKVDALQTQTEQAVEHYNEVAQALREATARHTAAVAELATAIRLQVAADRAADARVRALYMHGAPPGLGSLTLSRRGTDFLDTYQSSRWVVQQDRLRLEAARAAQARARAAELARAAAVAEQQRLATEAAAARKSVEGKLAAQQALLASASAQVQQLLRLQQEAEQRRADALAAMVRDAQRRTGVPGVSLRDGGALSPFVRAVLAAAEAELGDPYQWGATGPDSYDCSGLVQHAFAKAGIALPRTSRQQWYAGPHPAAGDLAPGDLLFWASDVSNAGSIHHVAIYLGGGYMIAAPHTGAVVRVQPVYSTGFIGATRVAAPASR